jgi:hypothetical protein
MATVFFLGYLVMTGHWLRGAALTLGLMTFWASYVTMLSLGVADELGGFWRDIALVAALMLTYGGPSGACPRCHAAPQPPAWRDRLPLRAAFRPAPAPAQDHRVRDQVSMEEMLSMFRADFERARPD